MYNITDEQLKQMTPKQARIFFNIADDRGELEEFSDWYWSKIAELSGQVEQVPLEQHILLYLEDYKRNLGRQYERQPSMVIWHKYNMLENLIRELTIKYRLVRKHKPYYLKMPD